LPAANKKASQSEAFLLASRLRVAFITQINFLQVIKSLAPENQTFDLFALVLQPFIFSVAKKRHNCNKQWLALWQG
jgi:hypothetical protein